MFLDRVDAGRQLAEALADYAGREDIVVFGIPRGGVVVAAEVASALGSPLDVVIAAKIGAPGWEEYAIGAVAPDGAVSVNPKAGYSEEKVSRLADPARDKVRRNMRAFREGLPPLDLAGKTAIVVDDGLATGLTAIAAVDYLKRVGAEKVVLAAPVAAPDSAERLREHADEVIALDLPEGFMAVGEFYARFGQTEDAEVLELLREYHGAHAKHH